MTRIPKDPNCVIYVSILTPYGRVLVLIKKTGMSQFTAAIRIHVHCDKYENIQLGLNNNADVMECMICALHGGCELGSWHLSPK